MADDGKGAPFGDGVFDFGDEGRVGHAKFPLIHIRAACRAKIRGWYSTDLHFYVVENDESAHRSHILTNYCLFLDIRFS
jgi:hypothetical protein